MLNNTPLIPGLDRVLQLDKLVHEPARLVILAILYSVADADFSFLMKETGLTQGNLSAHLGKLEEGGLIESSKAFVGKRPCTTLVLTDAGRAAFRQHGRTIGAFLKLVGLK